MTRRPGVAPIASRSPLGDQIGSQASAAVVNADGGAEPSDGAIQPLAGLPPIWPENAMDRPSGDQATWLKPATCRAMTIWLEPSASASTTSATPFVLPGWKTRQASLVPSRENVGSASRAWPVVSCRALLP